MVYSEKLIKTNKSIWLNVMSLIYSNLFKGVTEKVSQKRRKTNVPLEESWRQYENVNKIYIRLILFRALRRIMIILWKYFEFIFLKFTFFFLWLRKSIHNSNSNRFGLSVRHKFIFLINFCRVAYRIMTRNVLYSI